MSSNLKQAVLHAVNRAHYDAYLEVRTSLFHFDRLPLELEKDEERQKLEQEVAKQKAINEAIQTSSEYSMVVVPEQELKQALDEIYQQLPEGTDLDAHLENYGLTHAGLRDAVELDLRVAAVLTYVAEQQAAVTDMDAELFYHLHNDRFVIPEKRIARHILITVNDDFQENSEENARERSEKLLQKLRKKPEKFEKLALSTSECPTALEGGMLGTLTRGQLYSELDAVLFSLNMGDLSEVTRSPLGYHIIKCDAIEAERNTPFAEVKEKIKDALRKRNQRVAQKRWLQNRMKHN
jgi:peptidyl-prolyl cis-trans isomerase C